MATIGFIGLGNMGAPMAANVVKAGHKVVAFDLVKALRDQVSGEGSEVAESAVAAADGADVVITMLPAGKHVRAVWADILPVMSKQALVIDCSTIDVESAKAVHAPAAKHGLASVDAPVSGGTGGQSRNAGVLCGGGERAFADAKPFWRPGRRSCIAAVPERGRRQDLQQHDRRDFHDRGESLKLGENWLVASSAVRYFDFVRAVLVDHQLLQCRALCDVADDYYLQAELPLPSC